MSERNPWRTVGSRVVYHNAWIRVREDQVIRPDGADGIYGVVEAPIATGVLALTPDLEVYLVGQYRYPINKYSWEIIEGGAENGEDALTAAKRELREEAGLVASDWRPLGGECHLSNCFTSEVAFIFVAEGLKEVPKAPEPVEVLQIKKVAFKEAVAMVDRGDITDSLSVIALLRAEKLFR